MTRAARIVALAVAAIVLLPLAPLALVLAERGRRDGIVK